MKLDIGCGNNKQEGCIGLDLVRLQPVDIIADISRGFPFKDNTFDEIFCNHVLEHFCVLIKILEDVWGVAKAGAVVSIRVPYCQSYGAFSFLFHSGELRCIAMKWVSKTTCFHYRRWPLKTQKFRINKYGFIYLKTRVDQFK